MSPPARIGCRPSPILAKTFSMPSAWYGFPRWIAPVHSVSSSLE